MSVERAHVRFSGDVQGVGFRWRTLDAARDCEVTGFVRNLADGRVEVVAEGERSEVEAFVEVVSTRLRRHIRAAETSWGAATGEFAKFDVAR